jgi:hypothetical protein
VDNWVVEERKDEWWYASFKKIYNSEILEDVKLKIRFTLRKDLLYTYKISPEMIKQLLEEKHNVSCVFSPFSHGFYLDVFCGFVENDRYKLELYTTNVLFPTYICGIEGVKNISYVKDEILKVWYIQTEGGTLKDFYTLDNVDIENTTTNNVWDIYHTLGIEAAREFRIKEMVEIIGTGVDLSHIKLRADRLTFTGTIQSLTRYTMRGEKPFSKVGFEEIMENFYKTARDSEVDDLVGVSASIMCGKRARVGTSMFDLSVDLAQMLKHSETVTEIAEEEKYVDYDDYL